MDRTWSLVVCLGFGFLSVPVSSQDAAGTLFLISGPESVRAGTPTSLAVTVLSDLPSRVTAELTHGDTSVAQTEDSQGGMTKVLTLPAVSGSSVTHNSLLNLTVRGYVGGSAVFTNTTAVRFHHRNVFTFVQTDRTHYQPGDTVRVRIVSVQLDNRPYKGRVEITVQDHGGNVVNNWESAGNRGIVLRDFSLSHAAPLGLWTISTTINGVTDEKNFVVEHHDHPQFEVIVKTQSRVLVGDDMSGSVRALYPSGQPVRGTLTVSVALAPDMDDAAAADKLTQSKDIYGSTQFFFSKDQLESLHPSSGLHSDCRVHVVTSVTSNFTGLALNRTVEVHLTQNMYQLAFHGFPPSLRPSLHFSTKLRVSRYDQKPLSSQDRMYLAVVEVTQIKSTTNAEPATLTFSVPEDGDVHVEIQLQDHVEMLFILARFQSSEETLRVHNKDISPSSSYIQIIPITTLPAQVGLPLQIVVESTFEPDALHFVVSAKGQVLRAGTFNSLSFSLTPTLSWSPEACVTVYCILSSGEVTSDTVHVPIEQHNHISVMWSTQQAQPFDQVTLSLTALEPESQVGIVVMGMHDDKPPEVDLALKEKQSCCIWMLTRTKLYKQEQSDVPENGDVLMVEKYWSHWMDTTESLLWIDTDLSDETWTSGKITVPDVVTALGAVALVMSDSLGLGFTPVPLQLTVSKGCSMSLHVPSYLIRGEEIVLEVNIINHLERELEVIVFIAPSKEFEFVLGASGDVSVVNAQILTLKSHDSASALFPIRPVALGDAEISVDAVCAQTTDNLVWSVSVKPEGVEQLSSETIFLELPPDKQEKSNSVSFHFPADVVPGSQRAYVALVGDILGLSLSHLDSLVQLPLGCGEQNMIRFAPSVFVLQYLDKPGLDDEEIRKMALGYMMEGYQRQLSFQRDDGSFSAFGASDSSGSTWLTAFVLRCFIQARSYMTIDNSVLTRAMMWLLGQQGPQGEFTEVGSLIHTETQGALDRGSVALTAYVLIALLEDDTYVNVYPGNVSMAQTYLEGKVSSGVVGNYSLCLVAYALALANSPATDAALSALMGRADYADGVMMWASSAGLTSRDGQPYALQIEMVSYVLLTLYKRGNLVDGFVLLKWLSKQRNHLGGYGSTQDTVVALQALSYYAAFSGASAINLQLEVSAPESSFASVFSINYTNYRTYQSLELIDYSGGLLNIHMEGRGFALFQMNMFYNVNLNHTSDEEAFSLHVGVSEEDHDHILLRICMRLKDRQVISHTGMAILDVGILSGFRLPPTAAAPTDLIRRVEIHPEKISLYLDSVTKSEVCLTLPFIRNYKVARVQDAAVHLYDYYEPQREAWRTYTSEFLHNMDVCSFCGPNCDRCRPGVPISVSHPLTSRSGNSATCSLSCLLFAVTFFLN
ncbi:CD109 antigen-like [Solea senegalensis]|uniref:CD109 antigen-like n=2 Tax=Solea senegalensis TaxID=28829 RepID=A0AAV6S001_SOLSE|nr:CD109 antigen [Solea senegalensis]KAG7510215.1 CD109 antigen-like [Solea senegalensis]